MSEEQTPKIQITPIKINKNITAAVDAALAGMIEANQNVESTVASQIQKRGFRYSGDTHQSWGLGGQGLGIHGFTGQFGGRANGLGFLGGFSLQPFGIGRHGLLNQGAQASLFAGSGAGVTFTQSAQIAHLKMAMAVEAYKGFGIIKNVIDLMCNFASEGLKIFHPRPPVRRFYETWAKAVDLQGRVKDIIRYYYKYGNVFIYTTFALIDSIADTKLRSTRGDTNDPAMPKRVQELNKQLKLPLNKRSIPWRYTLLNPFQMDLRGSRFFGEQQWVFTIDEKTMAEIKNKTTKNADHHEFLDETEVNLPPEFKSLPKVEGDRAIQLNQAKLWILQYMKDDHEDWADPMVWPVMNDVMYKNALRAMDRSVINSTINAMTIFKLGNMTEGYVVPPNQIKEFAEMLRTPTYSHNLIWNDAISIESNYPPIEKILGVEKYRSVDKDILAGLGVPSILVDGGEGGSFSNAFLQVRTLLERLEEGRREAMKWIDKQLKLIADIMGHRDVPTVKFGQMSLKDEKAEKQLIIQLLDRNIISSERVHEVFDIDTKIEISRIREENKLAEKEEIFVKHGPFKDPMTDFMEEDRMDMEMDMRDKEADRAMKEKQADRRAKVKLQQQKQVVKPRGRPAPSTGIPQQKKRDTKPQGQGLSSLIVYENLKQKFLAKYSELEEIMANLMLDARGVKYKKSLSKEDRLNLEGLTYAVFSNISTNDDISKDLVLQMLASNPTIAYRVDELVSQMSDKLRASTVQDRREIRASAMALYYMED